MRIGILYDIVRWEEKALIEATRRLGHEVEPIQVTKRVFWLTRPNGYGELDFVLQRCVSFHRALASTAIFEEQSIPVVNSYDVIRDCEDKLYTTLKLVKAGVPVPETAISFNREKSLEAGRELGYPLVVKPIYGSWGRMITRAVDEDGLLEILEFRENMQSPYFKVHYLQEFVEKPGRDIRVFYFWGEVPAGIYRVSKRWKTNTALGGEAVKADLSEELVELVSKAAEAMGGGVLGVDIMERNGGEFLVGEVNAIPEFRNTVRVTGRDLAEDIIRLTVKVFKQ